MITKKITQNDQNIQAIKKKIDVLLNDIKQVDKEMDDDIKNNKLIVNRIDENIDKTVKKTKKIFTELDKIEKDAGDKMDTLILNQIKDLTTEEEK